MVRERAKRTDASTGKLLFSCSDDMGLVSPDPRVDGRVVDYLGYLHYAEGSIDGRSECLPCTRRAAFFECPYPTGRGWQETIHELDFVKKFPVQLCPEVVRFYHQDADVRVMVPNASAVLAASKGYAEHAEAILEHHGDALHQHAPRRWKTITREAALYNFFRGKRGRGIKQSLRLLMSSPTSARTWVVMIGGSISPTMFRDFWIRRRARITDT